jgi:hypothetical protein
MWKQRTLTRIAIVAAVAVLSSHCNDAAGPERAAPAAPPRLAQTASSGGIQLDQSNGTMGTPVNPLMIIKGFNPTNPHVGDAIVATFFWFGAPGGVTGNIIDSVTDVLTSVPYTPVGNKYTLVEFVSNGTISMATYVATNVQNFPDAGTNSSQILAVKADLHVPVTDAGVLLSAWTGVASASTLAIGEHRSGSGTGTAAALSGPSIADPGAISLNAGALAYGLTLASPPSVLEGPPGWTDIAVQSDLVMKNDGEYDARYTISPTGGTTHPTWNWYFTGAGSWLASVLALNPPPTTGDLTVTTTTTGDDIPATGYTLTVDGTTSQTIGTSGSVTFASLAPGAHSVVLSNVPANCQVSGASSVSITVVAGETATASFVITCSAPPPPLPPNDFVTGGGKLAAGREFATFGVEARSTGGKLQWVQHCPDGVNPASPVCARGDFSFHGTVTPGSYAQGSRGPSCRTWTGTGDSRQIGTHSFTVREACDGGEPGRGRDYIEITIDDYQAAGYLSGGDIHVHRSSP